MARDQQHVSSNPFLEIRREAFGDTIADVGVAPFDSEYRPGFEAAPIGVTAAEGDEKLLSLYEVKGHCLLLYCIAWLIPIPAAIV